jgi:hypothetical protein
VIAPSFHRKNITLRFRLERTIGTEIHYGDGSLIHGVQLTSDLAVEQIMVDFSGNNTTIELSISYNIWYNLTAFATLCGHIAQSDTINLYYGDSEYTIIIGEYSLVSI